MVKLVFVKSLNPHVVHRRRYLAIDHGQKRTGLAVSDASETLVSPHSVIETQKEEELLKKIVSVVDDEKIEAVVIGLPFNMDGTEAWTLVEDGKILKIQSDTSSERGERSVTLIYEKK